MFYIVKFMFLNLCGVDGMMSDEHLHEINRDLERMRRSLPQEDELHANIMNRLHQVLKENRALRKENAFLRKQNGKKWNQFLGKEDEVTRTLFPKGRLKDRKPQKKYKSNKLKWIFPLLNFVLY